MVAGNLIALLILMNEVRAQDTEGYIYGRVKTLDNMYEGQIRWGEEETFWSDQFDAAKIKDKDLEEYREKLKKETSSDWSNFDWDIKSIWEDKVGLVHQFTCQFGDIMSIMNHSRSKVILELKNGEKKLLNGDGYNDIGAELIIYDKELGEISVDWDRVMRVDFLATPKNLKVQAGTPIFGTVETFRKGTFTGLIQWDHDERLGAQKLDGDSDNRDISIPFSEVKYIEKSGNGSKVVLFSGKDYLLVNSNDVNSENRGIIVDVADIGRVDIPWRYFRSVTLKQNPGSGPSYDTYKAPSGLKGKVYTVRDDTFEGRILFDIDEAWEVEMVEGSDDGVQYEVPMRNIKAMLPKNYNYSMVELRNGERILLGDGRDVSDKNDGLLVFNRKSSEPDYIPWKDIVEIIFD